VTQANRKYCDLGS